MHFVKSINHQKCVVSMFKELYSRMKVRDTDYVRNFTETTQNNAEDAYPSSLPIHEQVNQSCKNDECILVNAPYNGCVPGIFFHRDV